MDILDKILSLENQSKYADEYILKSRLDFGILPLIKQLIEYKSEENCSIKPIKININDNLHIIRRFKNKIQTNLLIVDNINFIENEIKSLDIKYYIIVNKRDIEYIINLIELGELNYDLIITNFRQKELFKLNWTRVIFITEKLNDINIIPYSCSTWYIVSDIYISNSINSKSISLSKFINKEDSFNKCKRIIKYKSIIDINQIISNIDQILYVNNINFMFEINIINHSIKTFKSIRYQNIEKKDFDNIVDLIEEKKIFHALHILNHILYNIDELGYNISKLRYENEILSKTENKII